MRLGVGAALVDGRLVEGDVEVEGGVIAAVGLGPSWPGSVAVPGFVDAHINGVAGVDFLTADADGYREAAQALAATGVVAFQPTFISSPVEAYAAPLAAAAEAMDGDDGLPRILGVHLEGPFLSPEWPGAHDPAHLLEPDLALADELCDLGPVTTVTLAPELPGALQLIEQLVARGVVVACGHSDADAKQARKAFGRGASVMTHLHNAHRRWAPRDPGIGGVALIDPGVTVQMIVDGVHQAPETARGAHLAARERFCLVTDAVEAALQKPGEYMMGDRQITVKNGAARLADGRLAGSVLTMDQGVRNLVAGGASVLEAVHAASTAPARLLGQDDLGVLRVGGPAHVTVLDEKLKVVRTLVGGAVAA